MYIYSGIFKSLSLDWSNILSQILVYPTSTKHMYFSGRNISWSLEPIYPSCQVIDLGDYFNLSVHTPLQILFYIKRVPNLSVSLYFEDKGRAVASRILKSNILSYAGPKFRNNDLSNPIDMKVLLKLSPQCKFNLTAPFPKGHSPSNSDMMISQNRIEPELLQFSVANRYHIGGGLKISWHVKSEKLFISQDREQRSGTIIRSKGQYQGL